MRLTEIICCAKEEGVSRERCSHIDLRSAEVKADIKAVREELKKKKQKALF